MASPCHDDPAVPWDPGVTQRGQPGAGQAISAAAKGCEGMSHQRASLDREKKLPGDSKAGPMVCGEQGRWLARTRSDLAPTCQGPASPRAARGWELMGRGKWGHQGSLSLAEAQPRGALCQQEGGSVPAKT